MLAKHFVNQMMVSFQLMRVVDERLARDEAPVRLLFMTAAHESDGFQAWRQYDGGPARGPYQMEPATLEDLLTNYLGAGTFTHSTRTKHRNLLESARPPGLAPETALFVCNHYATVAARLQYWRRPEPLPAADDLDGLAMYAKDHWNTYLGAATWQDYRKAYDKWWETATSG